MASYNEIPPELMSSPSVNYIVWRYYYEGSTRVWTPIAAKDLTEAMLHATELDAMFHGKAVITKPVEVKLSDG